MMNGTLISRSRGPLLSNFVISSSSTSGLRLRLRSFASAGLRSISSGTHLATWKKETPSGGLTELYVYHPESKTLWPDPILGILSPVDSRFNFPGNIGPAPVENSREESNGKKAIETAKSDPLQSDIITRPTNAENQAQVLYSANDFIQYMSEAESYVCSGMLESFPGLEGSASFVCELHEAPKLLKKQALELFANKDQLIQSGGTLSVLTLSQKTVNDMSCWTDAMETERETLTDHFFTAAKEICARLKSEGYWADFIDPSSGTPYFSPRTNMTMFETDEKYRLLGFRIEDLGCCKVICHREFARNVFVGTIFTNAHPSSGVVQEIFEDLRISLNSQTEVKSS